MLFPFWIIKNKPTLNANVIPLSLMLSISAPHCLFCLYSAAVCQLLSVRCISKWAAPLRGRLWSSPLCRIFSLWILLSQVSCCDSLWCIFPAGTERGRSPCEPCRSSPLSSRARPSVRTSPWWSSSPLPSCPSSGSCRFSLLRERMRQLIKESQTVWRYSVILSWILIAYGHQHYEWAPWAFPWHSVLDFENTG